MKGRTEVDRKVINRTTRRCLRHAKRCGLAGKKKFETKRKARLAAEYLSREFDKPFRIYECPVCGKWHTTTSAERVA